MHIRYSNGRILEGIILNLNPSMARVALRDRDDAEEFRLVAGQWLSEEWEPVVFEFPRTPVVEAFPWFEAAHDRHVSSQVN